VAARQQAAPGGGTSLPARNPQVSPTGRQQGTPAGGSAVQAMDRAGFDIAVFQPETSGLNLSCAWSILNLAR